SGPAATPTRSLLLRQFAAGSALDGGRGTVAAVHWRRSRPCPPIPAIPALPGHSSSDLFRRLLVPSRPHAGNAGLALESPAAGRQPDHLQAGVDSLRGRPGFLGGVWAGLSMNAGRPR